MYDLPQGFRKTFVIYRRATLLRSSRPVSHIWSASFLMKPSIKQVTRDPISQDRM